MPMPTAGDEIAFWVELRRRYLTPAEERIGNAAANRAQAEGRKMGWDRALKYAFEIAASEQAQATSCNP